MSKTKTRSKKEVKHAGAERAQATKSKARANKKQGVSNERSEVQAIVQNKYGAK